MRAALLVGVFVIGCGAVAPIETNPSGGFTAREPTVRRACSPLSRLCAGAERPDERLEVSALGILSVECEMVLASTDCPQWSARTSDLALLTVATLPERSFRIRLGRVRVAVDGVLAIDRDGAGTESGEPDPVVVSGWVSPGSHELDVELTYTPSRWGVFVYSYAYRMRRSARIDVPVGGAVVRVRSGERGRVTQSIDEGLFIEVETAAR